MAFTDLDFSLPQWGKSLNDTLRKIWGGYPSTSEWSTSGLKYLNGFAAQYQADGNDLHYRTIDVNGTRTIQFAGWIKTPAVTDAQVIQCVQVPSSIFNGHTGFIQQHDRYTCWWSDQWVSLTIDPATGIISMRNMATRGDKSVAASAFEINYSVSW